MTDQEIVRHLAEKAMGWEVAFDSRPKYSWLVIFTDSSGDQRFYPDTPDYIDGTSWNPLGSIADAFEVVEVVGKIGDGVHFVMGRSPQKQTTVWFIDWIWAIAKQQNAVPDMHDPACLGSATCDTFQRAICLAAVEATR